MGCCIIQRKPNTSSNVGKAVTIRPLSFKGINQKYKKSEAQVQCQNEDIQSSSFEDINNQLKKVFLIGNTFNTNYNTKRKQNSMLAHSENRVFAEDKEMFSFKSSDRKLSFMLLLNFDESRIESKVLDEVYSKLSLYLEGLIIYIQSVLIDIDDNLIEIEENSKQITQNCNKYKNKLKALNLGNKSFRILNTTTNKFFCDHIDSGNPAAASLMKNEYSLSLFAVYSKESDNNDALNKVFCEGQDEKLLQDEENSSSQLKTDKNSYLKSKDNKNNTKDKDTFNEDPQLLQDVFGDKFSYSNEDLLQLIGTSIDHKKSESKVISINNDILGIDWNDYYLKSLSTVINEILPNNSVSLYNEYDNENEEVESYDFYIIYSRLFNK